MTRTEVDVHNRRAVKGDDGRRRGWGTRSVLPARAFGLGVLFLALFLSARQSGLSQPLFQEQFDYQPGTLLVNNGWIAHSASGFNRIIVTFTHLDYPGYPPNVGNSVMLSGSGEDLHKEFNSTSYGSVYVSFLVRVLSADTYETYFLHLSRNPFLASMFRAKVFVKSTGTDTFDFGISKEAETGNYTGNAYTYGQTYVVVIKYRLFVGSNNDIVSLFVFEAPTLPNTEPSPTVVAADNTAGDIGDVGSISLRQGGISSTPELEIDGIRVATSWNQAPLPVYLSAFQGVNLQGTVRLSWTTVREEGSSGFWVERSDNDRDWERLAFIPAAGSRSGAVYHYEDVLREDLSSRLWYRLRMIDTDGTTQFSDPLPIDATASAPGSGSIAIAPQPVIDHAVIRFSTIRDQQCSVRLFSATGGQVAVFLEARQFAAGDHTLAVHLPGAFPSGVYFLVIGFGDGTRIASPVMHLR